MDSRAQHEQLKADTFLAIRTLVDILENEIAGEDPKDIVDFIECHGHNLVRDIRIVQDIKANRRKEADRIIKNL